MSFDDCCKDNGRDFRINFLWQPPLKKKKKLCFDIIDQKKKKRLIIMRWLYLWRTKRERKKNISSLFFNEQF